MTDLLPLQTGIYSALAGPSGGPYPVFDAVPQSSRYPYIVIGEIQAEPGEEIEGVTSQVSVLFHTWSRFHGKDECHEMHNYIASVLDNLEPIEVEEEAWWMAFEEFRDILEDPKSRPDARVFHGVSRYQFRTN